MKRDDSKILFITQINPFHANSGVSVVINNLLKGYPRAHVRYIGYDSKNLKSEVYTHVGPVTRYLHVLLALCSKSLADRYIVYLLTRYIRAHRIEYIIGLYPTLRSIAIANRVAARSGVSYFPYLHDTIEEGLKHTPHAQTARQVEQEAFKLAKKVISMSAGLSEHFDKKYGTQTFPLEHSFPEKIEQRNVTKQRNAFWGGAVYAINDKCFNRLNTALASEHIPIILTRKSAFVANATPAENIVLKNYPERTDYIAAVQSSQLVLLAINWPDESDVDEVELSTIFPTKTIEYLATGSLIIAHCPEHYFLAKFIRKHQCGIVVSDRDEEKVRTQIAAILTQDETCKQLSKNALTAAGLFSIDHIKNKLDTILYN